MKKIFTQISIILVTLLITSVNSAEKCEPEFKINKSTLTQNNENSLSEKGEVFVFFDQSKTMQGFTIDQPGQENLFVNIVVIFLAFVVAMSMIDAKKISDKEKKA